MLRNVNALPRVQSGEDEDDEDEKKSLHRWPWNPKTNKYIKNNKLSFKLPFSI